MHKHTMDNRLLSRIHVIIKTGKPRVFLNTWSSFISIDGQGWPPKEPCGGRCTTLLRHLFEYLVIRFAIHYREHERFFVHMVNRN